MIDDFEAKAESSAWNLSSLITSVVPEPPPTSQGGNVLYVKAEKRRAFMSRSLDQSDWRSFHALALRGAVFGDAAVELRVAVSGPRGRAVRYFDFTLHPGSWCKVVAPLRDWRPGGGDGVLSFAAVAEIAIEWRGGGVEWHLDDIRLLPGHTEWSGDVRTADQWMRLAFPEGGGTKVAGRDFTLLLAAGTLGEADAVRLLRRLDEAVQHLKSRFKIGGLPIENIPVLIVRDRAAFRAFFHRLGRQFGVRTVPPSTDGFFYLGIGICVYAGRWDSPVIIHEAMHGVLRQLLDLEANGSWVHEGLAMAIQLHFDSGANLRESLRRRSRAEPEMDRVLGWRELVSLRPVPLGRYVEVAGLFEFLCDTYPDRLSALWSAVQASQSPIHVWGPRGLAEVLGESPRVLEQRWRAWIARCVRHGG